MVEETSRTTGKETHAIWTVHDVAVYLRVSESKIYRLVKQKRIPVARIGKTWRFRKDLLDEWLTQTARLSMNADGK
jgi:putative molybdopterin biosynthesis protein